MGPVARQRSSRMAEACAFSVIAIALVVFSGWLFDLALLKSFIPGSIGMKLATATGFLLLGVALLIRAYGAPRMQPIADFLSVIVVLLATVTILEYASGRRFFVDQLWSDENPGAAETVHPGRMAPYTAVAFIAAALAVVLARRRSQASIIASHVATAFVLFVALLVLVGYAYGAREFRGPPDANPMAFSTALGFVFCGLALAAMKADQWPLSLLAGSSDAAFGLRVLLPTALIAPLILGWFRVQAERFEYVSRADGTAAFALLNAIALAAVVVWTASRFRQGGESAAAEAESTAPAERSHGWSLAQKGLLIVAVPTLFQLAFLASLFVIENTQNRDRENALRAKEIRSSAYKVLVLLVDVETGIRGYALSGDRRFMEPYEHAEVSVPRELGYLRVLTAPWSAREQDVVKLGALAMPVLRHYGAMRTAMLAGKADRISDWNSGKRLMDDYRRATSEFMARQHDLEVEQDRVSAVAREKITSAIVAGCVIALALAAYLATYFMRSISGRVQVVLADVDRLQRGETLHPPKEGGDEIEELHRRFHRMAEVLSAGRRDLQLANEGLESFSYSVSHDLRAPLRAVDGYARIIDEDYGDRFDADGKRLLGVIRGEARRMGALIDDLLTFSRLGRQRLSHATIDMHDLISEILPRIVASRPDRQVDVTFRAVPSAIGDRSVIKQVLVNLLSNAVKYAKEEGHIAIEIGGRNGGRENLYWVRDSGVGFDMRYVGKLFGVFQRLHHDTKFEGTGVGLAIVQRIIAAHGGRVWAEGEPDRGATFYFTLPATAPAEKAQEEATV